MVFAIFFAIAAFFNLDIDQMNIQSVFLYSLIDELVYVVMTKIVKRKTIERWYANFVKLSIGSSNFHAFGIRDEQDSFSNSEAWQR